MCCFPLQTSRIIAAATRGEENTNGEETSEEGQIDGTVGVGYCCILLDNKPEMWNEEQAEEFKENKLRDRMK